MIPRLDSDDFLQSHSNSTEEPDRSDIAAVSRNYPIEAVPFYSDAIGRPKDAPCPHHGRSVRVPLDRTQSKAAGRAVFSWD